MRGEHFLLLAECEQLLAPVVLAQLRRILAQQHRPATGEAVARLLVDRSYLTAEQARRLIDAGSGAGSPLVPQVAAKTSPVEEAASRSQAPHQSDELLLAPDDAKTDTRPISQPTAKISNPPAKSQSLPPSGSSPLIPTKAELEELTDSLRQWMELPGTLDWNAPPSPLFAPPRWQATPAMLLLGAGGILVLVVLGMLAAISRWSAG